LKVRARDAKEVWKEEFESSPSRDDGIETSTISGIPLKPLYTADDLPKRGEEMPGLYPYTRGIHPGGYRGRLWTMRQFSGFATAEETNRRYKYLLANGQTGLSVAFDMPTLMGQDSDAPTSRGEIGHCGVAIDSLADMETLFDGIPLGEITTSMTINSPAAILLCMYIAVAEKQGVPASALGGTLQNDILKEFIAQKEFIFPPEPSMRLVVDSIEYCAKEVPKWNTISISGYHIREAGSTAAQELAFTLADGMAYVDACLERGMRIDDFASRLSFFFDAHIDFFEDAAYGLAGCVSATAPRMNDLSSSGSTRRRPESRLPLSSRSSTSPAPQSRRSPRFSAARSRCTRMRWTRCSRCRRTRPRASRCERSSCSHSRPA